MTRDELNQLSANVKNLPRDVRLAALQGLLAVDTLRIKLSDEKEPHPCNIVEATALVANELGFFEDLRVLGLLPQKEQ